FALMYPSTAAAYTLSLHDALPIWSLRGAQSIRDLIQQPLGERAARAERSRDAGSGCFGQRAGLEGADVVGDREYDRHPIGQRVRSEEHTSELQSRENLVCRLLLEK